MCKVIHRIQVSTKPEDYYCLVLVLRVVKEEEHICLTTDEVDDMYRSSIPMEQLLEGISCHLCLSSILNAGIVHSKNAIAKCRCR